MCLERTHLPPDGPDGEPSANVAVHGEEMVGVAWQAGMGRDGGRGGGGMGEGWGRDGGRGEGLRLGGGAPMEDVRCCK